MSIRTAPSWCRKARGTSGCASCSRGPFLDSLPRYAALIALGPTKLLALERTKLESLLEVLHRSGWQIAQLTAYVYRTEAKY